jgi:hypothetical protein
MYRASKNWDRVCIDIHDTRNMKHDVFIYRIPNSGESGDNTLLRSFIFSSLNLELLQRLM